MTYEILYIDLLDLDLTKKSKLHRKSKKVIYKKSKSQTDVNYPDLGPDI